MKTPPSNDDELDRVIAALRRDAARIQEPPFDLTLHHAMLRRIHAMRVPGGARGTWWRRPTLAGVAALAVLALCIGLWFPRASQNVARHTRPPAQTDFAAALASTNAAVASLSSDASSTLPAWMSPTAPLLDPPYLPSVNPKP
jgi:hypothetical protein